MSIRGSGWSDDEIWGVQIPTSRDCGESEGLPQISSTPPPFLARKGARGMVERAS